MTILAQPTPEPTAFIPHWTTCSCGCGEALFVKRPARGHRGHFLPRHAGRRGGAAIWGPEGYVATFPGAKEKLEKRRAYVRARNARRQQESVQESG